MTRGQWFAFVAVCSLAALLAARVRAQDDRPPPAPVREAPWEYRVFVMDYKEFREKDDWKEHLERAGGNEPRADVSFKTHVLNWLAEKEGWELVQVLSPKPEVTTFYLRRPRRG